LFPSSSSSALTSSSSKYWYQVYYLNCDSLPFTLRMDYTAVNPGGEYLSAENVFYKVSNAVLGCYFWLVFHARRSQ
jgi:hypothetical protein